MTRMKKKKRKRRRRRRKKKKKMLRQKVNRVILQIFPTMFMTQK